MGDVYEELDELEKAVSGEGLVPVVGGGFVAVHGKV